MTLERIKIKKKVHSIWIQQQLKCDQDYTWVPEKQQFQSMTVHKKDGNFGLNHVQS